jgi:peptide/nickel transport system permease protein
MAVLEWIWRILIWGALIGAAIAVVVGLITSRYARQKLLQLVIVLFAVTLLTFTMLRLIDDKPEITIAGLGATPEQLAQVRETWGLDKPIPVQYVTWLKNVFTGDLGNSSSFNVPVTDLISQRLPVSFSLMLYALTLSLLIAIPLGVLTAYRANTVTDRAVSTFTFGLLSVPSYIMGVLLVFLFALKLDWFPAQSKYYSIFDSPSEHFRNMVLPVLTLAFGEVAIFQRLLRADMAATLQNDFITLARAKGMPNRKVLFRHALRPSTFSLITAAAVNVGALIGGAVIVEQIFGLPGMGQLTVEAVFRRDFLVVQICVVIFAVAFVLVNFLVDVLYSVIDPRIRHARALA